MDRTQEVVRRVDDFTDEVMIELKNYDSIMILDGDIQIEIPLYWQTKYGFYLLISSLSDKWIFKGIVDKDNSKLFVIADDEKFTIENGINIKNDIGNGYYELYSWILSTEIIEKLINSDVFRLRFGAIEFPEVPKKMKESWRAVYNAGKKEDKY